MPELGENRFIAGARRQLTNALKWFCYGGVIVLLVMMVLTMIHVVGRYGFNHPLYGHIEILGMMLVAASFLTGAYVAVTRGHIVIGILVDRFSERTQAIINSITYLIWLVFVVFAFIQTFKHGVHIMETGMLFRVTGLPYFPILFLIGIGWVLFSLAIIANLMYFLYMAVKK